MGTRYYYYYYWTLSAVMLTMSITIDVALCYYLLFIYYVFQIITKSGLYRFLSNFQGMSGMAKGWDVNSGVVNGCTIFARYVAINSNFHFFCIFLLFLENLSYGCAVRRCAAYLSLYFEPKMAFVASKLAKIHHVVIDKAVWLLT
jgi:hypothetical protein